MAELIPLENFDDRQAEAVYAELLAGKSKRAIARRFNISVREVDHILQRAAPLDERAIQQARSEQVMRLGELQRAFYERAKESGDPATAMVVIRASEQLSAIVGMAAPPATLNLNVNSTPPASNVELLSKLRTKLALLDNDPSYIAKKGLEQGAHAVEVEGQPLP